MVNSNPTIGITNSKVEVTNGNLVCSFSRDNTNSALNYFQINNSTKSFIIAAYGAC